MLSGFQGLTRSSPAPISFPQFDIVFRPHISNKTRQHFVFLLTFPCLEYVVVWSQQQGTWLYRRNDRILVTRNALRRREQHFVCALVGCRPSRGMKSERSKRIPLKFTRDQVSAISHDHRNFSIQCSTSVENVANITNQLDAIST